MGKYVYRKLLDTDEMIQWAKEQGFSYILDSNDLHATIVYSEADFTKAPNPHTIKLKGGRRALNKFSSKYGNKQALVLEFSCRLIEQQHAAYLAVGATSEFPTFLLHITLTYNGSDIDISEIEPYKGPLFFSEEYQEPITNEPWKYNEIELSTIDLFKIIERKKVLKLAGNMIDLAVEYEKDNGKVTLEQKLQAEVDFETIKTEYINYELKKK